LTRHAYSKAAAKKKLIVEEKISFVAVRAVLNNFEAVAKWVVTESCYIILV